MGKIKKNENAKAIEQTEISNVASEHLKWSKTLCKTA